MIVSEDLDWWGMGSGSGVRMHGRMGGLELAEFIAMAARCHKDGSGLKVGMREDPEQMRCCIF